MRYLPSSFKHGITREQINQVVAYGKPFEIEGSSTGLERVMFVGWDNDADLLEIGVAYPEEDEEFVFHAAKASKTYREKVNQ